MLGKVELVQVRPDSPCRKPSSRSSAMRRCPCRFESFFPSGPGTRPWCSTSGSSPPIARAIRCWSSRLGRWSLPRMTWVIPSFEIVRDRGQLIRHRAVQREAASFRHAPGEPTRRHLVRPPDPQRSPRLRRRAGRARSGARAPRRTRPRATRDRPVSPPPHPRPSAWDRCRRSSGPPRPHARPRRSGCHRRQRVPEMERAGRARREADANRHAVTL